MAIKQKHADTVQADLLKVARLHYLLIVAVVVQIILYDSWKLLDSVAVLQRWVATALLLCAVTGVWYFTHNGRQARFYHRLTFLLIAADVAFASFAVYNQRGMASRAVMLFILPLMVAAVLRKTSALYATALLCIAAYVTAAVSYFVLNFNEGYKIELYGEISFYSALIMICAVLLAQLTRAART